jgi:hypothetical protein
MLWKRSRDSDWLRDGRPRSRSSSPSSVKNILFSMSSRPALGPTQPPIHWVQEDFLLGWSGRGVKLTTHLQLVPRSRKLESIPPHSYKLSWRSAKLVKLRNNFTLSSHFSIRRKSGVQYITVVYLWIKSQIKISCSVHKSLLMDAVHFLSSFFFFCLFYLLAFCHFLW